MKYNSELRQFAETKTMFSQSIPYKLPVSYEQWMEIPHDLKAAVLFVQFYDQITLAWLKTKSDFVVGDDGVSTVLQYLMKNVEKIENDSARFKPGYIYTTAYNCLYCISHDIKRDIDRYYNETSNIVANDDDELDLFDTVVSNSDFEEDIATQRFWDLIEDMDMKTKKVINHILNDDSLKKLSSRSKEYKDDSLRDVSVSSEEMDQILKMLKVKLAPFHSEFARFKIVDLSNNNECVGYANTIKEVNSIADKYASSLDKQPRLVYIELDSTDNTYRFSSRKAVAV